MRYRNLKLFSLILALILQLQLVACGGDSGTNNTNNNFPVVVFSDVHFNPFYDPSLFPALVATDAGEWESIFKTSSITAPSAWGSDTNYPLLALALSSIRQNLGASPLIIFTGDILGHNFPQTFYQTLWEPKPSERCRRCSHEGLYRQDGCLFYGAGEVVCRKHSRHVRCWK